MDRVLREITDALVESLIATVLRIGARADRRVTQELVNAFKRVTRRLTPRTDLPGERPS